MLENTPNDLIKAKTRLVNEETKKLKAETDRVAGDKTDLQTLQQNLQLINTTLAAYRKAYTSLASRRSHLVDSILPVFHARVKQHPHHPSYRVQVENAFTKVETEVKRLNKEIGEDKPPTINSTGMTGHAAEMSAKKDKTIATLASMQKRFQDLINAPANMDNSLKALESIVSTINAIAAPGAKLNKQEHEDPVQIKSLMFWTEELKRQLEKKENQPVEIKELEIKLHEAFAELDAEQSKPRKATEEAANAQTDLDAKKALLMDLQNDTDRQNHILKLLHAEPAATAGATAGGTASTGPTPTVPAAP